MGAFADTFGCGNQYTDRSPYVTAIFPRRATISLEGRLRGLTIACESGKAWVTQLGDARDYVLWPRRDFTVRRDEQVVVQILEEARITFRLGKQSACELHLSMSSGHYSCEIRTIPGWKLCFLALRRHCGSSIRAASPYLR